VSLVVVVLFVRCSRRNESHRDLRQSHETERKAKHFTLHEYSCTRTLSALHKNGELKYAREADNAKTKTDTRKTTPEFGRTFAHQYVDGVATAPWS
jgi:hypothetical protein